MTARHRDGTVWERMAGYCRAVRHGAHVVVSGTTASSPDGTALHPGDVGAQAEAALRIAVDAVVALGGRREDVVRTRLYLVHGTDWRPAAEAHARVLGDVEPANTLLYVAGLVGPDHLVEVEVDALVGAGGDA